MTIAINLLISGEYRLEYGLIVSVLNVHNELALGDGDVLIDAGY